MAFFKAGKKKYFFLPTLALGLALLVGWLYSRNALFRLSEIQVSAEEPELANEVRASLIRYLGRSLFSLPLGKLENELKTIARIESLTLNLKWPSTLLIEVKEKTPVAMLFSNGALWVVNEKGELLEKVIVPEALPLLKKFKLETPEAKAFLQWLARAQAEPPGALDLEKFQEVRWDEERGFILKSYELEVELEVGSQNFDRAWFLASKAFEELQNRGVEVQYLDATYSSRVVVHASEELQNYKNELNLKELVRRKDNSKPAAR